MINKFLWQTILEEGKRLKVPQTKKRGLLREYLQTKIIYSLYGKQNSNKLSFIGGTSLRILRDLDRFSEDLDFDNLGLSFKKMERLFEEVFLEFRKEGFVVDFDFKGSNNSGTGDFRFKRLLSELGISSDKNEKLRININWTAPKIKSRTEVVILRRFGFLRPVTTNTLSFLLSQKIRAVFTRKDPQPRDFYDIVWFFSRRVKPDAKLFPEMKVKTEKELLSKLGKVYEKKVEPNLASFKKRLKPFLIKEENVYYLDVFKKVIKEQIN